MKEALIEFETAKLAKEKDFNWACDNYYYDDGSEFMDDLTNDENDHDEFTRPSQSLLAKWLREEHNILICVYSNASGYLWEAMRAVGGTTMRWSEYEGDDEESGTYTTYEKAMEDGLKQALKLI